MYAERLRQCPVIPDGVDVHLTLAEVHQLIEELTPRRMGACVELQRLRDILAHTVDMLPLTSLDSCV